MLLRNSKNIFLTEIKNNKISKKNKFHFSLLNKGDNHVFSPLRSEKDLKNLGRLFIMITMLNL